MSLQLAALALSIVAAIQNPQAAPPPAGTAKISGLVTRSDTNQALADVTIRLVRWEGGLGQPIPTKRTESDGRFIFDGLRAGEYVLTFSAEAFVTLEFGNDGHSRPAGASNSRRRSILPKPTSRCRQRPRSRGGCSTSSAIPLRA